MPPKFLARTFRALLADEAGEVCTRLRVMVDRAYTVISIDATEVASWDET